MGLKNTRFGTSGFN